MVKILCLLLLSTGCAYTMSKTKHGVVMFDKATAPLKVSDRIVEEEACNKLFLIIPYRVQMFDHDEVFAEALKKNKAKAYANVTLKESFSSNFFITKWCQGLKGNLLIE